jgi:hypothetical protein
VARAANDDRTPSTAIDIVAGGTVNVLKTPLQSLLVATVVV